MRAFLVGAAALIAIGFFSWTRAPECRAIDAQEKDVGKPVVPSQPLKDQETNRPTSKKEPFRDAWYYREEADKARDRAQEAFLRHDQDVRLKAIQEEAAHLESYLKQSPDDIEILDRYARLQVEKIADESSLERACSALEKILEKNPDRIETRKQLIRWLLAPQVARYNDALEHCEYLVKKNPDDAESLTLQGTCEIVLSKSEKAVETLQKAIAQSPKEIEAYLGLASALRQRLNRPEEADRWIKKMVEANPDSAQAHRFRCDYLLKNASGDTSSKEALSHAEKAVQLAPEDAGAVTMAASVAFHMNNLKLARNYVEKGLALRSLEESSRIELYDLSARIAWLLDGPSAAYAILQKAYDETKSPVFLWVRADWKFLEKDFAGAKADIEKLESLHYDERALDFLRGMQLISQKKFTEAIKLLDHAKSYFVDSPPHIVRTELMIGLCYRELRNFDQQIAAYRRVLAIDPNNELAKRNLVEALQEAGKRNEAMQEANGAIASAKDPRTWFSRINLLIDKNRQLPPEKREWAEIEKLIAEAKKTFPENVNSFSLLLCDVYILQDRFSQAESLMRDGLKAEPKNRGYWRALVLLTILQRKWSDTEKSLASFEQATGDTVTLRLIKAQYWLTRFGSGAIPRLKSLREKVEPFSDDEKLELWGGLLEYAKWSGDQDESQQLLKLLAEKAPDNLNVQHLRFESSYQAENIDEMKKILGQIERIEGKGPFWLYGQAALRLLQVQKGGKKALLDESLDLLKQAKAQRPTWSKIMLLTGQVYDLKGENGRAMECYLEALQQGDFNLHAIRRTVEAFLTQQRYKEADALFTRLERGPSPLTPDLIKIWAESLMGMGDTNRAVEKVRSLLKEPSLECTDRLWAGRLLLVAANEAMKAGRVATASSLISEAENLFRQTVISFNNRPEPWVTLIEYLVANKRLSEAEDLVEMVKVRVDTKWRWTALAQCYEVMKKNTLAEESYRKGLEAAPDDPQLLSQAAAFSIRTNDFNGAEKLLKHLLEDEKVKATDLDRMQARRHWANLLLQKGGYENLQAARKLIETNLKIDANSALDRRLLAFFDSRNPGQQRRRSAVQTLENLRENGQATKADLLHLSRLYLDEDRWEQAQKVFQQILAVNAEDPEVTKYYVLELLSHQELDVAETYLEKLHKALPEDHQVLFFRAEYLIRRKKVEEMLRRVREFVNDPLIEKFRYDEKLQLAARGLEECVDRVTFPDDSAVKPKILQEAESYWKEYAEKHPSAMVDLAAFLARHDQHDKAAKLLEENWKVSKPIPLVQACLQVAQFGRGPKEISDRMEILLLEARRYFDNHPAFTLTLGDLFVGEEKYDKAEEYYRDVLEKFDRHAVAMNNLAVLLSIKKEKLPEALELINKAMEIAGPLPQMLDTRACVYLALGDGEKALADLTEALADAKTPDRLFHLAQAYELLGKPQAAAMTMQKALKKGLQEKTLPKRQLETFKRLKKRIEDLPPSKEDDLLYDDDIAWKIRNVGRTILAG